jgi:uncharacterized protein (DUF1810 family)
VVVIDLDENDDAQVIFETLNALGTPLLPADLIKNFLFQSAEVRGDNSGQLYERYWKPFDERSDFWRAAVSQGRLKRPRIDQFLQHYLTLMKGDEVQATHLFAEFRVHARKNPTVSAADHLLSLHSYGGIFERFFTGYNESSREGQFFYRLGELETTTFFPLLLEVFKAADDHPQQEVQAVLVDLESFIVRRMVCGLTTKNYNLLVRSLIQKLRAGDRFSATAIRDFLLSQDAESTRWPTDAEFHAAWLNRAVYKQLTRGRVRIVLEALELALHTGRSEKVKIESKLTIEHVMPQKWGEHWPLPGGVPAEEAKQLRDQLLHTFGNLTLVTGMLNPAMSNSAWTTKKAALSEHGAFALNRKITLCALPTWDETAIKHRAVELFHLAKTIWPKPVAAGTIEESVEQRTLDALLPWNRSPHPPKPGVEVAKGRYGLPLPQARILQALLPVAGKRPSMSRIELARTIDVQETSGTISVALGGRGDSDHKGLLDAGLVTKVKGEGNENAYQITTDGIKAIEDYLKEHGELPPPRDPKLNVNIRYQNIVDDPHDLNRFVQAQAGVYDQALAEVRSGKKRSHWMWFIFPQVDGLSSNPTDNSKLYAIKSIAEAEAYLSHPILGPRLVECAEAALSVQGRTAHEIFGSPDDMKLRSCATLFANVSQPGSLFHQLLDTYYRGERDSKTLRLLGIASDVK